VFLNSDVLSQFLAGRYFPVTVVQREFTEWISRKRRQALGAKATTTATTAANIVTTPRGPAQIASSPRLALSTPRIVGGQTTPSVGFSALAAAKKGLEFL
jgi:hypothetical protein